MPTLEINGKEYIFDESQVIDFTEGLVGLPEVRRAALIPLDEFEPFCWLASIDDEKSRFVVVDPNVIFPDYDPTESRDIGGPDVEVLTIVKIASDWTNTTVNLRAPIFIETATRRGAQHILSTDRYGLAEAIPQG